jgi:hypothetical protein
MLVNYPFIALYITPYTILYIAYMLPIYYHVYCPKVLYVL